MRKAIQPQRHRDTEKKAEVRNWKPESAGASGKLRSRTSNSLLCASVSLWFVRILPVLAAAQLAAGLHAEAPHFTVRFTKDASEKAYSGRVFITLTSRGGDPLQAGSWLS